MKVEIGVYDKYPMERIEKYKRFVVEMIILEGEDDIANHKHKLNKKIIRKKRDDAYAIAKRWKNKCLSKGWSIRQSLGTSL
jgi:hypothetical protein